MELLGDMHRNLLLEMLKRYQSITDPTDLHELQLIKKIADFIEQTPNCFSRKQLDGHITVSSWLLDHQLDKVLLTHHKKFDEWIQLGGHADHESNPMVVALSEAREESGINNIQFVTNEIFDLDIHDVPAFKQTPRHFHYDIRFALYVEQDEPFIVSDESYDLAWFDIKELLTYGNVSVKKLATKWLAKRSSLCTSKFVV